MFTRVPRQRFVVAVEAATDRLSPSNGRVSQFQLYITFATSDWAGQTRPRSNTGQCFCIAMELELLSAHRFVALQVSFVAGRGIL